MKKIIYLLPIIFLFGCASEVDKCVSAKMKSFDDYAFGNPAKVCVECTVSRLRELL